MALHTFSMSCLFAVKIADSDAVYLSFISENDRFTIMNFDNKQIAGLLLFAGVVQMVLLKVVCETAYSAYNVGQQPISDLGNWGLAGNFAVVFTFSSVLFGACIMAGAYLVRHGLKSRLFIFSLALAGACNIGVGLVAEDVSPPVHGIIAIVMFVSWAVAAILSYKLEGSPFSFLSLSLGSFSLVMFFLSFLGKYASSSLVFGLGFGGTERLVVYPLWLWTLGFGAYLMASNTATLTGRV